MGNCKEWREKQRRISDEELSILTRHINENMKKHDQDIEAKMELSDREELNMYKVRDNHDDRIW